MKIWYYKSNKWLDDMPAIGQACFIAGVGFICGVVWFPLIIPFLAWRIYYLATRDNSGI